MDELRLGNDEGGIAYRRRGQIAHIVLQRPDTLNALTRSQLTLLREAIEIFDHDDDALIAILSGEGRAFCSGADVIRWQLADPASLGSSQGSLLHDLMYGLDNWKPIIAAAHGYAVGAGLALVLQADLSVVCEDTQMQVTEVAVGLGDQQFWRKISFFGATAFASSVAMTGRFFSGQEAADAGLVTLAVPAGTHLERAEALANEVLRNPPLSVRSVVRARRHYMQQSERDGPLLQEAWRLHETEAFQNGAAAFARRKSSGDPAAEHD